MSTKLKYCGFFLLYLLCSLARAESDDEQALETVKLQLKWFHSFQFAGYYMAKEKGFYADAGLNVEILERDPKLNNITQVVEGEADYGVADSALLMYRATGSPVRIMASIFQHSPLIFVARGSSDLMGPESLIGKRIAYQKGLDDAPLLAMLQEAGIKESDFTFVPPDFTGQAFINGEVDAMSAYLSNQPFRLRDLGIDFTILNPHNYGIDFYGDILFARDDTLKNHPERSERFMRASIKGWRYALEHPAETIGTLIVRYRPNRSREHLEYEADVIRRMVSPDLVEIGYTSPTRFYRIAEIYRSVGRLDQDSAEKALKTLIWHPDELNKKPLLYLYIAFGLGAVSLLVVLAVLLVNNRLQNLIDVRTFELSRQKRMIDRHVIISETDLNGRITGVSEAFCRRTGYNEEELLGKSHGIVRHPERRAEFYTGMWRQLNSGESWEGELHNIDKQGNSYWVNSHIEPIRDFNGKVTGYRGVSEDITDHKRLELLSTTDRLTGLANRFKLDQVLEAEFNRAERYDTRFSIILLDIDYFKRINDQYGHLTGDEVLKELAVVLTNETRTTDLAGRWGGEEFMVICPGIDEKQAQACAEKLRSAVEKRRFSEVDQVTISLGVCCYHQAHTSVDSILHLADLALYRAKREGRNRSCIETESDNRIDSPEQPL